MGFVGLLSPDDPQCLRAAISELTVDPKVTLAEYIERTPQLTGKRRKSASAAVFIGASYAQVVTQPAPPPVPPPPVTQSDDRPPPVTQSDDRPPSATRPSTATQPPTATQPRPPPPQSPLPPHPPQVLPLIAEIEKEPIEDVIAITTDPEESPPPGAKAYVKSIINDDANAAPDQLRKVLTASRLSISGPAGAAPKLSPQGVVVNLTAEIEGYKGKRSVVRWSLFDARERTRMPQSWLRDRKALRLIAEAGADRGSGAVRVPLPRRRGPYFVRLELFDDRDNRLALADTDSFDR